MNSAKERRAPATSAANPADHPSSVSMRPVGGSRRGQRVAEGGRSAETRERLLKARPVALGSAWACDSCKDTERQGRRIEGGWPGTLPEARVRVLQFLDAELTARGLPLLSAAELAEATAATYDRARRDWHQASRGNFVTPTALGSRAATPVSGGSKRES